MSQLNELKRKLKRGAVYRRTDLTSMSNSIDRHLAELVADGTLKKLAPGIYHYPKQSTFGATPPDETTLIRSFLKDERFLITSPNAYNSLGVGTTQLHNTKIVYNHKRHGEIKLGNRSFLFQMKPAFPKALTPEYLLVDLVNNIDQLAEDNSSILYNAMKKARHMDAGKLKRMITHYGNARTKKLFASETLRSPMPAEFLHRHKDFKDLLNIVADEKGILPGLVEKDYWIKHVLYSMTQAGTGV